MVKGLEVILVPNLVEANGKTIRQNNMERMHAIPLKTLVEIVVEPDDDYCMDKYRGVRAYVVTHERDCDGTPLYGLCQNRDLIEEYGPPSENAQINALTNQLMRSEIHSGLSEDSLRVINSKQEEWKQVPTKGAYVVSSHPITTANPSLIFCIFEVRSDHGKIWVRGQHTIWFNVDMLRPPTDAEFADPASFHPTEL